MKGDMGLYKVLVVEDNEDICKMIKDYFTRRGEMEITLCYDGDEAIEIIDSNEFDIILLDVMLPGANGFELCECIRQESAVPIIFITARVDIEDVIKGYRLGCDDYVTKPFVLSELYMKVIANIKRAQGSVLSENLNIGGISLNPVSSVVTVNGQIARIPAKEFEMLRILMINKGRVITKDMLIDKVWEGEDIGYNVLNNHIKNLRKILGDEGGRIKTIIKRGYLLSDEE